MKKRSQQFDFFLELFDYKKALRQEKKFPNIVSHLNVFVNAFISFFCENNCTKAAITTGSNEEIIICQGSNEAKNVLLKHHFLFRSVQAVSFKLLL